MVKTAIQVHLYGKFLEMLVEKYWKRRSFVMIVNSAMLTMKTGEIGAAIWAQRARNNIVPF